MSNLNFILASLAGKMEIKFQKSTRFSSRKTGVCGTDVTLVKRRDEKLLENNPRRRPFSCGFCRVLNDNKSWHIMRHSRLKGRRTEWNGRKDEKKPNEMGPLEWVSKWWENRAFIKPKKIFYSASLDLLGQSDSFINDNLRINHSYLRGDC